MSISKLMKMNNSQLFPLLNLPTTLRKKGENCDVIKWMPCTYSVLFDPILFNPPLNFCLLFYLVYPIGFVVDLNQKLRII